VIVLVVVANFNEISSTVDQIVVLCEGKIVEQGSYRQLMEVCEIVGCSVIVC
jgi:ABC-type multidrug transport system fused ATPase/permease subunit